MSVHNNISELQKTSFEQVKYHAKWSPPDLNRIALAKPGTHHPLQTSASLV